MLPSPPIRKDAREIFRPPPPAWLFSLLPMAGAAYPFTVVAMPFLLRREGIAVETIGGISGLALLPLPLQFLYAPLTDIFLSRRNWTWIANLAGALLLLAAILLPRPRYLTLFTLLLAAANILIGMAFIAINGLMAVVLPEEERNRVAGWFQVGNIGSIAFLGGAALWLVENLPVSRAAPAIALMSFLPSVSVLFFHEPARSLAPTRAVFAGMAGELGRLFKRRGTWLGLVILLTPIGAGAGYNLFTAIGQDFHASPRLVLGVTGIPGGVLASIAGALLAGTVTDLFRRRIAYIFFGGLIAVAAGLMALGPLRPAAYAIGCLGYQFATAMAWVAGTAFMLELAGRDPASAATRMALFNAAQNAPFSYMPWLDGLGYRVAGVRGLLGTDAILGLAAAAGALLLCRRFWRRDEAARAAFNPTVPLFE